MAAATVDSGILLSTPQLAALLGRPLDSLRQMIRQGRVPAPLTGGGRCGLRQYWDRRVIERWIAQGMPCGTPRGAGRAKPKRQ
jgi:hypothetical protein